MKNFLLLVFTSTRHANIFCNTNLPSIREIYPIRIASSFDGVFNYNLKAAQNGKEIIFNSFGLLRSSVVTREPFSLQRSSVVTRESTNYGDTWDSIGYVTGADQPYTCRFSSLQTGWVGGTYGEIFKSTNGGATWNIQYINNSNVGWIKPMYFHSDSIGWAAGGNTTLLFTSTSGATFISYNGNELPADYILKQNYPNPFNSQTIISYSVPKRSFIQLKIYDILGKEIKEIENEMKEAGNYRFVLDASGLTSGIYFIRLTSENNFFKTRKMILIK